MSHPPPTPPGTALEQLQGAVERVNFHNPESGFCVLRVKVRGEGELVTVVGTAATITAGEYVTRDGRWTNDREHGLQFKALELRTIPPNMREGIEKYLGSGMVKGIGPHFAKKLVRAFGKQVFDIIEQAPERLLELAGIGPKRQARVTSAWAEQKVIRAIMVFLHAHGWAPRGRCASSRPTASRRSSGCARTPPAWRSTSTASASKRPTPSPSAWASRAMP
jgi:exodeoxyribonuclease V alpha subunit